MEILQHCIPFKTYKMKLLFSAGLLLLAAYQGKKKEI